MPLVLGGHSFINQLGSDPPASEEAQRTIVEACLNHGIAWFDTTYQPERRALGNALHALGRRDEATIFAWNFFPDFSPDDPLPEPEPYRPGHIDVILEQLRTTWVDCLVVHPVADPEENRRQEELAADWLRKGYARSLGVWVTDPATVPRRREGTAFRFAIHPFNITTGGAGVFATYKRDGWETIATSPFARGWELDRIIAAASARGEGDAGMLRPALADLMLRFALFQPGVDRVIVAMRKVEWVARNVASAAKGPLSYEEHRRLRRLHALAADRPSWGRRLWRRLAGRR